MDEVVESGVVDVPSPGGAGGFSIKQMVLIGSLVLVLGVLLGLGIASFQ